MLCYFGFIIVVFGGGTLKKFNSQLLIHSACDTRCLTGDTVEPLYCGRISLGQEIVSSLGFLISEVDLCSIGTSNWRAILISEVCLSSTVVVFLLCSLSVAFLTSTQSK